MTPEESAERDQANHMYLWDNIHNIINIKCFSLVPVSRQQVMATALTEFVIGAIDKYAKGQEKHGGDITDRDLDKEIQQEHTDEFWYLAAMKWKRDGL